MYREPVPIVLHDPSAADVKIADGKVYIGPQYTTPVKPSCINVCSSICESAGTKQVWTVTFQDIDFGDCNACNKDYSLMFQLMPPAIADGIVHRDTNPPTYVQLPVDKNGTVTAAQQANAFAGYHAASLASNNTDWYVESVVVSGNTVIITSYDDYNVLVTIRNEGLPTSEAPTVVNTVPLVASHLGRAARQRMHFQFEDYVPGQGIHPKYFSECEGYCEIRLDQVIDDCVVNSVGDLDPRTYIIYANGKATGYAAFKTALIGAFPGVCTSTTLGAVPATNPVP